MYDLLTTDISYSSTYKTLAEKNPTGPRLLPLAASDDKCLNMTPRPRDASQHAFALRLSDPRKSI